MIDVKIHLKDVLRERGLTQKELSEMTGIRAASISTLSRGYVDSIYLEHLSKIATALDIDDIRELITLERV